MKQMVCSVCSYTYDEAKGIPEAGMPQAGHCPPEGTPGGRTRIRMESLCASLREIF